MNCQKCSTKPKLTLSKPDNPIKFTPGATKICCKGCGYLFKSLDGKIVWGCKACNDYFLCSNCKMCPNSHALFKCYNLSNRGPPGSTYLSNKYTCDDCTQDLHIHNHKERFVWHCNPCEFDACPQHYMTGSEMLVLPGSLPDLMAKPATAPQSFAAMTPALNAGGWGEEQEDVWDSGADADWE